MSTFPSDPILASLRESETRCHTLEARIKALRMQLRTLIEDRERSLSISVDTIMSNLMSEPDFDDLWEVDQARLGEDLVYRIVGGES